MRQRFGVGPVERRDTCRSVRCLDGRQVSFLDRPYESVTNEQKVWVAHGFSRGEREFRSPFVFPTSEEVGHPYKQEPNED